MAKAILSGKHPEFVAELDRRGFDIIKSETVPVLIEYEREHADMQCLIIKDTAFVLSSCRRIAESLSDRYHVVLCNDPVSGTYPTHVSLNALVLRNTIVARLSSLDPAILHYATKLNYQLINVNQGYTKCSCAVVSDNAVITADNGIYNSLKETSIDVLKIREGRVALDGADYGFIGGASGYHEGILYFTGNITAHPDYQAIKAFCEKYGTKIVSLTDTPVTDIGGIIFC